MVKNRVQQSTSELSYELYKELLEELLAPIEQTLDLNVQYELYLSKLVYLENLQQQCFRSINIGSSCFYEGQSNSFSQTDLATIQEAITSTHEYIRRTILNALEERLNSRDLQEASS